MNFKTPFKVLTTAALIGTLSLSAVAPGAASAAEKTATSFQAKAELTASHVVLEDAKGNLITLDYNTYLEAKSVGIDLGAEPISIKVGDKFYHLNDFLEAKSVSNNDLAEAVKLLDENNLSQDITPAEGAIEDGKLVVVPGDEDFKVTEIAAITDTIDNEKKLEFAVNGETAAADLEKLKEEGYTYEFTASKNVFNGKNTSTTGEVKGAAVGTSFDYTVTIFKGEEEVATSAKQTAKVTDSSQVVTEVTEVQVENSKTGEASSTLAAGEKAQLTVYGKTKDMKDTDEPKDITSLATFTSSKTSIATVNASGLVTKGSAAGTVTISAKAGDVTKEVTFTGSNEARVFAAAKSSVDTKKVETTGTGSIEVSVLDNFGDAVTDAVATDFLVDGSQPTTAKYDEDTKKYTLTFPVAATKTDVAVKYTNTEIGKFDAKLLVAGETTNYKLETTDNKATAELDLAEASKVNAPATPTVQLKLNGYDKDGLATATVTGTDLTSKYAFASKNTKVATIDDNGLVTAGETGETEVYAYLKEDGFKTPVATATIKVVDNTPKITGVTFKGTEAEPLKIASTTSTTGSLDLTAIVDKISVGSGKADVAADGTITYTNAKGEKFNLGSLVASANTITTNITGGKVEATSTAKVGKDTISVDVLDLKGNVTDYSTTVAVDLVTKAKAQENAQTAVKALSTVAVDAKDNAKLNLTFADDFGAEVVDVEKFLNQYLQFQVTSVYKVDGEFTKISPKPTDKTEAVDLTATDVATVLNSGWGGAKIDWTKVKVTKTDAKNYVLSVDNNLISATDLTDANKINSTNAANGTGYKISFAKKGDVASTHKFVLKTDTNKTADVATTFESKTK